MSIFTGVGEGKEIPGYYNQNVKNILRDTNSSTHPALQRDVLLNSVDGGFWNTLVNGITTFKKARYQSDIDELDRQSAELNKKLYTKSYANDDERLDIESKLSTIAREKDPILEDIYSFTQEIENRPVNPQYEAATQRALLDNDDYNWGELATDAGGSMTELWTQAALVGTSLAANKFKKPIVTKLAGYLAKKAGASVAAGAVSGETLAPFIFAGGIAYDAATIVGPLIAQYNLRKRETAMEKSLALEERYNAMLEEARSKKFIDPISGEPAPLTDQEKNDIYLNAWQGLEAVNDVNMDLMAIDYAQSLLMVAPWTKAAGRVAKVFGGNMLTKRLAMAGAEVGIEGQLEKFEEHQQTMVAGAYKRGDFNTYDGSFGDRGRAQWDVSSEVIKSYFGLSEDQLTKTDEYEKAGQAGLYMGMLLGGTMAGAGSIAEVKRHLGAKKAVFEYVKSNLQNEEVLGKVSRFDDLYKKGRAEYVLDLIEKLNSTFLNKKGINGLTEKDIEDQKFIIKNTVSAIERLDGSAYLHGVSKDPLARKQVLAMIVGAKAKVKNAQNKTDEIDKELSDIYSTLSSEETKRISSDTYSQQNKNEQDQINAELTTLAKVKEEKKSEYEKEIQTLLEHKEKSLIALQGYYSDLSTEFERDSYIQESKKIEEKLTSDRTPVDDKYREFVKTTEAGIGALNTKLKMSSLNDINISNESIKTLHKLDSTRTALLKKIEEVKEKVDIFDANKDETNEAKSARKLLNSLNAQKIESEVRFNELQGFIIDEKTGFNDEDKNTKKAVSAKIQQVLNKVNENPLNKDIKGNNITEALHSHRIDQALDLAEFGSKLIEWGEVKSNRVKISDKQADINLLKSLNGVHEYIHSNTKEGREEIKQKAADISAPIKTVAEIDDEVQITVNGVDHIATVIATIGNVTQVQIIKDGKLVGDIIEVPTKNIGTPIVKAHDSETFVSDNLTSDEADLIKPEGVITIEPSINKSNEKKIEIKKGLKSIVRAISTMHVAKDGKVVNRNEEYTAFVSDSKNRDLLKNAVITLGFDMKETEIWDKVDKNGILRKKIETGEKLTSQEIDKLANGIPATKNGDVFKEGIPGAPIKVIVSIGDKVFSNGLYLHDPSYVKETQPDGSVRSHLKVNALKTNDQIQGDLITEFEKVKTLRKQVVAKLSMKAPVKITSNGITVSTGMPNNTKGAKFHIPTAFNTAVNKIKFFVVNSTGTAMSSKTEKLTRIYSQPGMVMIPTNKTCNGESGMIRVSSSKLTREHAEILTEVMIQFTQGKGRMNSFDNHNDKYNIKGVTLGEIADLLSMHGERTSYDDNTGKWDSIDPSGKLRGIMKDRQLFVDLKGRKLYYGQNIFEFRGKEESTESYSERLSNLKKEFTEWAITNKNYPVSIYRAKTFNGIGINDTVTKSFEIGSWKYDSSENKTMAQILIDNPVSEGVYAVTTDVQEYQNTGSLFKDPVTMLNDSGSTVTINGKIESVKTSPIINKTEVKVAPKFESLNIDEENDVVAVDNEEEVEKAEVKEEKSESIESKVKVEEEKVIDDFDNIDAVPYVDNTKLNINRNDVKPRTVRNAFNVRLTKAKKEIAAIRKLLGDTFSIKIVDDFIKVASSGAVAYATMERDLMTIASMVEEGTSFHEAWHRVSMLLLEPQDQLKVYNQARIRFSKQLEAEYGKQDSYTNDQVEEVIAEEFRKYMLNKQVTENKLLGAIKNLFERVYNYIKFYLLKKNPITSVQLEHIFETLATGKLRYSKPLKANYESMVSAKLPKLVVSGTMLQQIDTAAQLNNVVQSLVASLLSIDNVVNIKNVSKASFQRVKDDIKRRAGGVKYAANNSKTLEEKDENLRLFELYREIYNKFEDTYMPLLDRELKKLNIEIKSDLLESSEEQSFETDLSENLIGKFDENPIEQDQKDKVLPAIKYMLATLEESPDNHPFTGMPIFSGFAQNWKEIVRELHHFTTIEDMMNRLAKLAEGAHKWTHLQQKLQNGGTIIKTQFHQVVRKHRHNFINLNLKTSGSKRNKDLTITESWFIDTLLFNERNNLINKSSGGIWGKGLQDSYLVDKKKGEQSRISIKKYNDIIAEYALLKKYVSSWVSSDDTAVTTTDIQNKILDLLRKVGIATDNSTLDYMSYLDTDNIKDKKSALYNLLSDQLGHLFSQNSAIYKYAAALQNGTLFTKNNELAKYKLHNILGAEGIVAIIAEAHVNAHLYKMNDMVFGAENKPYYAYSENNIVSDTVYDLKSNKGVLEEMLGCVNNRNSIILKALRDNPKIADSFDVVTFAAFNDQDSNEISEEYIKLNIIEDYIMKALAANEGFLPFPVLASKKMYYMFKGLSEKNTPVIKATTVVNNELVFTDETINAFYGYFLDETNRINQVQKEINDVTVNGVTDYDKLTQWVHYMEDKSGKRWHQSDDLTKVPVGLKYVTFPEFNESSIDVSGENEVSVEKEVKAEILNMLEKSLQREIEYTKSLNIISEEKGKFKNVKLPTSIIKKYSTDIAPEHAVKTFLANSMVNQMIGSIETEKIISGESISYKPDKFFGMPTDDQIKRLSVLSSTGANFVTSMVDPYFKKGTTEAYDDDLTNEWYKSITLHSNIVKSAYYEELSNAYVDIYKGWGYSEEKAKLTAKSDLKNYTEGDSTDAQAFITPMMYRQIKIRLGEWSDSHQKSFEALTDGRDLSLQEEIEHRKFYMEPLKLVYFGHNRTNGGLDIAQYDKMSLATLFPKDIKGKEISKLYDAMTNNGIHMTLFDSATKSGNSVRGNYHSDDNVTVSDFSKIDKLVISKQWKYLRRQLMTDPHDKAIHKVGTQVLKVILSNIQKGLIYTVDGQETTGEEMIQNYFGALKQMSNNGKDNILTEFGIDNEGNAIEDSILQNILRKDAIEGKMPSDTINSLNGDINLDLFSQIDWVANRIMSKITKKTIDVELPGGIMVQQSNIGFREVNLADTQVNKKTLTGYEGYVEWVRNTPGVKDLKFYNVDSKKGLEGMECLVSVSLFKNVIPNYKNISFEEAKEWLKSNPEIIGYRIPTQGQVSVVALKVVGFLSETAADTIILPSEFTTLTGSDFDIDKLYTIRYNYKIANGKAEKVKFLRKTKDESVTSKSFNIKYYRKLREVFNNNKHIFQFLPEYKDLMNEITSAYAGIDEKDSEIGLLKIELNSKLDEISITEDIARKEILKSEVAYLNNEISNRRLAINEIDNYSEAVIEKYSRSPEYMDKIADILISRDKFVSKEDFLKKDEMYQNVSKAIQNKLISTMFAVIKSEHHIYHTTKPLDVLKDVLKIKQGKFKNKTALVGLERISPYFQSKIKVQYGSAKQGVAFPALHNVHHSMSQAIDLFFTDNLRVVPASAEGNTSLHEEKGIDGRYISDWLSAMINAFVDIEKDPYIIDLNINNITYNTTYLLLRLGLGEYTFDFMPQPILKELAKYGQLAEGSITDIADYKDANSKVKNEYLTQLRKYSKIADVKIQEGEKFWSGLIDSYESVQNVLFARDVNNKANVLLDLLDKPNEVIDTNTNTITNAKEIAAWYFHQLEVLNEFNRLKAYGDSLNSLVKYTQIDTKKFGSNIIEIRSFLNGLKDTIRKGKDMFGNIDKMVSYDPDINKISSDDTDTHLSTLLNNSIFLLEKVLKNRLLQFTDGYSHYFNNVLDLLGKRDISNKKIINAIGKEIHTQLISEFFTSPEYMGLTHNDVKKLYEGEDSIINRIYTIQRGDFLPEKNSNGEKILENIDLNKQLKSNPLFTDLFTPEYKDNMPDYLRVSVKSDSDVNIDVLMAAYSELLISDNIEVKRLAKDLLISSYFSSGFKRTIFSFHQFIPTSVRAELEAPNGISLNDFMTQTLIKMSQPEEYEQQTSSFVRSIIKNMWSYNSIVPKIFDTIKDEEGNISPVIDSHKMFQNNGYPVLFQVSNMNSKLYIGKGQINSETGEESPVYKPFVKYNVKVEKDKETDYYTVLGEYVGFDSVTKSPIYLAVPKTSMVKSGVVLKENGLETGLTETLPLSSFYKIEKFITTDKFKRFFPNFVRVNQNEQVLSKYSAGEMTEDMIEEKNTILPNTLLKINEKFNTEMTMEEFNNMSKEEQDNLLECL